MSQKMSQIEIVQTLEFTRAELETAYKKLGYTSSNVLKALDETIKALSKPVDEFVVDFTGNTNISTKYNVVKNAYLEEKLKLVLAVYRLDEAWNLEDILKQLVKATDILLKDKGYDGNTYEEMQYCSEYAKQLIIDIPIILGAISNQPNIMNSISDDELRDECERRGFVMNRDTDGFDN